MAGDDHPDRKVVAAAGERSKGEDVVLEEGEIAEEEEEPKADNDLPPSPPPPQLPPPPPPSMTTSPAATTTIAVEPPPVKKIKIINAGGSSAAAAPPPPPPRQVPCPLCHRMFDSYPAMFGHQRVHKERTYRGAFPPPTFSREGSPPAPPAAEDTEQAARQAAQLLIDISKGVWEKAPAAAVQDEPSSSSARSVLGLDLNLPALQPEEEETKEEEADDRKKKLNLDLNKSPQKSD